MDATVGGRAAFRFPIYGFYAVVRITALEPPRRVEWRVVASRHPANSGFVDLHDWIGTRISFEIEPIDATHSRLHFAHHGLVPLECSTVCTSGWSFFLGQSLRHYLETGVGQPTQAVGDGPESDFVYRVHLDAPPHAVYAAVATAAGLRSWWTADCDVDERVGGRATFRFGRSENGMEILALIPDREVRWRCVRHHFHAPGQLERTDEWEGTTLVFRVGPGSAGGTDLAFEHQGLVPALECYPICEAGWRHWLGASLKSYVETGKGQPFAGTPAG
jgi:uncharacterized protein YndB with AHSA1/START domain